MRCSKCGTETLPGKRFCAECGSPLNILCRKCGSENAPSSKFCADCGSPITARSQPPAAQSLPTVLTASETRVTPEPKDPSLAVQSERKTVTAVFVDLKCSTQLMEDLDPGGTGWSESGTGFSLCVWQPGKTHHEQ
jgi:uncharacterized OB-fold protein